jgi:hypothetical protein
MMTTIGRRGDGDADLATGIPRAARFFRRRSSQRIAPETVQGTKMMSGKTQKRR